VKIYLLSIDRRRFFFYADESEPPDDFRDAGDEHTGWRRWLLDRWRRLHEVWEHSQTRAVRWTRMAWDWMHSWVHPDEAMLGRLRSARRIELHYPASRSAEEVRGLWREYLDHRWWRHIFWLSANGILAPPALATLWVLPGPNVIGYWFAYRAVHHALIVRGIRRVRRGAVELALRPVIELDWPIEVDTEGKARHEAIDGEAPHLAEHVAWTESEPAVIVEPETACPIRPPADRPRAGDEES
jgi:hypothetical protein